MPLLTLGIVGSTLTTILFASPSTLGPLTYPFFKPPLTAYRRGRRWKSVYNHTKTIVMHFAPLPQQSPLPSFPLASSQLGYFPLPSVTNSTGSSMSPIPSDHLSIKSTCYEGLGPCAAEAAELKGVYTSFILPKLMYASPAWSSSLDPTQPHQLDKVKRGDFVPAYCDYESALSTLSLPRLFVRHEEALKKLGEGL